MSILECDVHVLCASSGLQNPSKRLQKLSKHHNTSKNNQTPTKHQKLGQIMVVWKVLTMCHEIGFGRSMVKTANGSTLHACITMPMRVHGTQLILWKTNRTLAFSHEWQKKLGCGAGHKVHNLLWWRRPKFKTSAFWISVQKKVEH